MLDPDSMNMDPKHWTLNNKIMFMLIFLIFTVMMLVYILLEEQCRKISLKRYLQADRQVL